MVRLPDTFPILRRSPLSLFSVSFPVRWTRPLTLSYFPAGENEHPTCASGGDNSSFTKHCIDIFVVAFVAFVVLVVFVGTPVLKRCAFFSRRGSSPAKAGCGSGNIIRKRAVKKKQAEIFQNIRRKRPGWDPRKLPPSSV